MSEMDPVWVHNLRSFIEGRFPPTDRWRALFREHFDKQNAEVKALHSELEAVKREAVEVVKLVSTRGYSTHGDIWVVRIPMPVCLAARAFVEKHGRDG